MLIVQLCAACIAARWLWRRRATNPLAWLIVPAAFMLSPTALRLAWASLGPEGTEFDYMGIIAIVLSMCVIAAVGWVRFHRQLAAVRKLFPERTSSKSRLDLD